MHPVKFPMSNTTIGGEVTANITHGMVLSRWKVDTLRERLSLLWHGALWLAVAGDRMPAVLLSGDQSFEITNAAQHGVQPTANNSIDHNANRPT